MRCGGGVSTLQTKLLADIDGGCSSGVAPHLLLSLRGNCCRDISEPYLLDLAFSSPHVITLLTEVG